MSACCSAALAANHSQLTAAAPPSGAQQLTDDDPPPCRIDVTDIISLGAEHGSYHMNAAKHSVVLADSTYHGDIKVGITFTAAQVRTRQSHASWRHWIWLGPVDLPA